MWKQFTACKDTTYCIFSEVCPSCELSRRNRRNPSNPSINQNQPTERRKISFHTSIITRITTTMLNFISLFAILIVGEISQQSLSFVHNPAFARNAKLFATDSHPEYSFDDHSDTTESTSVGSGDYVSVTLPKEEPKVPHTEPEATKTTAAQKPEYGALSQGTVIQIQVGDIALARKAWKKRRRSGSPLLVPCSVLNVDRQSMVRWNMMYLLEKFGSSQKDGIEISASHMAKKYRTFLKSSLQVGLFVGRKD